MELVVELVEAPEHPGAAATPATADNPAASPDATTSHRYWTTATVVVMVPLALALVVLSPTVPPGHPRPSYPQVPVILVDLLPFRVRV